MDTGGDIAILWADGDLRCVLSYDGTCFRLRLCQGIETVHEQAGADDRQLIAIGSGWREKRNSAPGRSQPERPRCPTCGASLGAKRLAGVSHGNPTWTLCAACGHVFAADLETAPYGHPI